MTQLNINTSVFGLACHSKTVFLIPFWVLLKLARSSSTKKLTSYDLRFDIDLESRCMSITLYGNRVI